MRRLRSRVGTYADERMEWLTHKLEDFSVSGSRPGKVRYELLPQGGLRVRADLPGVGGTLLIVDSQTRIVGLLERIPGTESEFAGYAKSTIAETLRSFAMQPDGTLVELTNG